MALENYHLQEETHLQIGAVSITIFDYLCLVILLILGLGLKSHSLLAQVNKSIRFHDLKGPPISRRSILSIWFLEGSDLELQHILG